MGAPPSQTGRYALHQRDSAVAQTRERFMNAKFVVLNGEVVPSSKGRVSIMTHGFSYGTGCFEGIRGYWNPDTQDIYIFRAREHFERLHRSCKILNMKLDLTPGELVQQAIELIRRNDYHQDVYIRPMVYKADEIIGVKLHDLHDHYYQIAVPMGDYVDTTGISCCVSAWRRIDDNSIPARAKVTGGYVNSALAKTEANLNGFGEAILLNADGHVSEGSGENIFLVVNRELQTPSSTENILLGITRSTVMELARRELDIITRERPIDRTELYTADEIFLCGTGAQIAPVVSVDHRPIGTGKVGPVVDAIQSLYADVVRGRRPEYFDWLTPVYGALEKAEAISHAVPSHSEVAE
jgi:branched-chain amino acid aminotransferase